MISRIVLLSGIVVLAACRDATEPARPAVPRPSLSVVSQITVTDLGTLGGDVSSRAFAINALGQVAGFSSSTSLGEHAFFWANGTMQALGTLGGYYSAATAMNDLGQVVGSSATASTDFHASGRSSGAAPLPQGGEACLSLGERHDTGPGHPRWRRRFQRGQGDQRARAGRRVQLQHLTGTACVLLGERHDAGLGHTRAKQ